MMLRRETLRLCHALTLLMCMSASKDFDWTKNQRTSFYYGTFPTGQEADSSQSKQEVFLLLMSVGVHPLSCFLRLCVLLQVSHGELEVLHIKLKARGTPMGKE